MPFWLTIEVQDGETPANGWRRGHGESLIEAALTYGAAAGSDTPHDGV